jgi:hypothetical protein
MYGDVELTYYSTYSAFPNTKAEFLPSYEDWAGQYGPTGKYLRELYKLESRLLLTDTGVSNNDWGCREIQSVVNTTISVHVKNYPTSIKNKAEALLTDTQQVW